MKKLTLIAIVFLAMISCKQKQKDNIQPLMKITSTDSTCINLDDYNELTKVNEKAAWLKEYGELVCKNILELEIVETHSIDSTTIESQHATAYKMEWEDLNSFISPNFYNAYLNFDLDSNSDVTAIKLIPEFKSTSPCYSIPFILVIGNKDQLANDGSIEFRRGVVNKKSVLLVITKDEKGNVINYYNVSGSPI